MCHAVPEDLLHAFFSCPSSRAVGDLLLSYAQLKVPRLSPQKLLRLDFGPGLDETDQLAILCIISTALKYIWQARADKMRAEVEAMVSILRKTRFGASADRILEIII